MRPVGEPRPDVLSMTLQAPSVLLVSAPKDTATQMLQDVTSTRPHRIPIGPPLLRLEEKSCANVGEYQESARESSFLVRLRQAGARNLEGCILAH